ncbi:hypothetical protein PENSTE_c002G09636 [Penicillium steckii]|uniref:Uncharacterized protein n=1 Tax=Penicillium steckii TaxID=303698 RepID=A0A1V6TUV0_9EURO|nr:hypothetical protein PENSTE_c002G09636 [Penicillium steckii]
MYLHAPFQHPPRYIWELLVSTGSSCTLLRNPRDLPPQYACEVSSKMAVGVATAKSDHPPSNFRSKRKAEITVDIKPRAQQCSFFLWKEEAEPREQAVVLSNSRSEDDLRYPTLPTPSTPTKAPQRGGLLTPQTERRFIDTPPRHVYGPPAPASAKARMMAEDSDDFGWDDNSDENNELTELSNSRSTDSFISQPDFHQEQPYKTARTPTKTSPGKRRLFESSFYDHDTTSSSPKIPTPTSTRSTMPSQYPPSSAELCMTPTPTKYRDVFSSENMPDMSSLSIEANSILEKHNVVLPYQARDELVDLLNRHHLKLQGVNKGREITRQALKKKEQELSAKDAEIRRLQDNITSLRAQKEMDQSIIDSMSNG